jgi:hypothetical protein
MVLNEAMRLVSSGEGPAEKSSASDPISIDLPKQGSAVQPRAKKYP